MACRLYGAKQIYLNKCWIVVNKPLRNKLQWNLNPNSTIFIQENIFKNVICKATTFFSWPQYIEMLCLYWNRTLIFALKPWLPMFVFLFCGVIVCFKSSWWNMFETKDISSLNHYSRDQSRYAPSQWETLLQCYDVSHWLGAYMDCFLL